jgi:two-component system response regulator AtoC
MLPGASNYTAHPFWEIVASPRAKTETTLSKGSITMRILVVDDEESIRKLVSDVLTGQGYHVSSACDGKVALDLAVETDFDLVFCDVMMDGLSGFDVLKKFRDSAGSRAEFVLMTGHVSIEAAIDAVQNGANDYICKPLSIENVRAMALAVEQRLSPNKLIEVKEVVGPKREIIGSSPAMIEVVKMATRVAATDLPVLICGESGTGKELIARLIHRKSAKGGSFVALNCGALPDTLLESELFGHTRGAFTGADGVRRGLFEEADGGTLLLDEVTETSAAFQIKLLRTLEEGEVRPLGSNVKKKVNVRIVSTTNRDPQALADSGSFRQDLLYRLQGLWIRLPPLRERREDIATLAVSFLASYNTTGRDLRLTADAMFALEAYGWPGNVRELRHAMQRLAVLSRGIIRLEDLPCEITAVTRSAVIDQIIPEGVLPTLDQLESSYLFRVLNAVGGNKSRAAQVMGVDRKTLSRMIDRQVRGHSEEPK